MTWCSVKVSSLSPCVVISIVFLALKWPYLKMYERVLLVGRHPAVWLPSFSAPVFNLSIFITFGPHRMKGSLHHNSAGGDLPSSCSDSDGDKLQVILFAFVYQGVAGDIYRYGLAIIFSLRGRAPRFQDDLVGGTRKSK